MRHYLSTLACSGLLSVGAFYGAPAFAGSTFNSVPDIAPTVDAAGQAFRTLPAVGVHGLTCGTAARCSGLQPGVAIRQHNDDPPGLQLVHGGGGGGHGGFGGGGFGGGGGGFGGHGFGGHGLGGFHGMNGFHGGFNGFRGEGFRDNRFGNRHFFNGNGHGGGFDNGGLGWGWYGIGVPYCDPYTYGYYGTCYPGY